jgi:acyl-CoA dehydrogenase
MDAFGAPLHSGIVAPYIWRFGTEEQKKRWLPKLASGEMVGAIAMSEPGTGSTCRRAHHRGEEGQPLRAQRLEDLHHQRPARQPDRRRRQDRPEGGAKGVSLMVVETDDAPGFRRGRKLKKLGIDRADTSELFFDDVSLPTENLLGLRKGRASSAHEGIAAGADDRRAARRAR